jgi:NAD(P)-dependent dehydrogenase (short-subunit alcohol dehydrogenase family)
LVVLLTGATGFIGRHLAQAVLAAGHELVCATRDPIKVRDMCRRHVGADFTRDFDAADWLPRLAGVDVVINAVGIIRERGAQTFDAIHRRAPCALFAASAQAGVKLVIQISALGADASAESRYHLSKKAADDFLAGQPVDSVIVQPSHRQPRAAGEFIPASDAAGVRLRAQLNWLLPVLRVSIALVWIMTGVVSLGLYPVADSYDLLARVGITGALAPVMLYGAALMDIALGVATLFMTRRRLLWLAQLAVILFYSAVISWKLPEFWLHPYGPLLKNLPMVALIWLLYEMEER